MFVKFQSQQSVESCWQEADLKDKAKKANNGGGENYNLIRSSKETRNCESGLTNSTLIVLIQRTVIVSNEE